MSHREFIPLLKAVRDEIRHGATDKTKHARVILGIYSIRNLPRRYTIRVRVPAGILTSLQLTYLAEIVEKEPSNPFLHITTRHGLEFGGVRAHRLGSVLRSLRRIGLTTEWTGGNGIRGIVCCSLSDASPESLFDVTPYALHLDENLRNDPAYQALPRKIKVAFESCGTDHVRTTVCDIGVRAVIRTDGRRGFQIFVGGGLGAVPKRGRVLEPFTEVDQLQPTFEAILRVFSAHGNRLNRSRARIKWLIEERGWSWFKEQILVERKSGASLAEVNIPLDLHSGEVAPKSINSVDSSDGFLRWRRFNVLPSLVSGKFLVKVLSPLGEISPPQIRLLSSLISALGIEARLTIEQNVLLRFVPEEKLEWLFEKLKLAGLGQCCADTVSDVTRCAGAALCLSGVTNSRAAAEAISTELSSAANLSDEAKRIRVRVSGCANSCSHHNEADIGLFGVPKRVFDRIVPHYALTVKGLKGAEAFNGRVADIPAFAVAKAVEKAVRYFDSNRKSGESFAEFSEREGAEGWATFLKSFTEIPHPDAAPDCFRDLGDGNNISPGYESGRMLA